MKLALNKRQTWIFLAALGLIALSINLFFLKGQPLRQLVNTISSTFGPPSELEQSECGVIRITTEYGAQIECDPDQYVHIQTVDNVDLERAENGIPVRRIFNAGGTTNLAPGLSIGLRTNVTYRICGGNFSTTDLYYVKCRCTRPPQGWLEKARSNRP